MVVGDIAEGVEVVVIGAGPGGYAAAIRAAQLGKEVVIIDKEKIGGICLNHGCIPAKSLIHAAGLKKDIQTWEDIGIHTGDVEVDLEAIQNWKDDVVNTLDKGVEQLFEHYDIEFKKGKAFFQDSNTLRVDMEHDAETLNFEKCIIATGSQPIEIPGFEFEKDGVISSRDLLQLKEIPDEMVVIGGGYIGMEAVTKFGKFGTTVKVVEAREKILANFDDEIIDQVKDSSEAYETEIYTNAKASRLEENGDKKVVVAEKNGEEINIQGDLVLVAAGRTAEPGLNNLELQNTDVKVENGFVQVDQQMVTDDSKVLAIGDAAGQPLLAHKAYMEAKVAAEVVAGRNSAFESKYIPKVVYTDPEVAVVGMTPEEAKEEYGEVLIGKFPYSASGRARTTNHTEGFVRVVANRNEKIAGVQIVGPRASDTIAEATLALEMQAYLDDVTRTIHAHPTFPETFAEACEDAKDESVHTY